MKTRKLKDVRIRGRSMRAIHCSTMLVTRDYSIGWILATGWTLWVYTVTGWRLGCCMETLLRAFAQLPFGWSFGAVERRDEPHCNVSNDCADWNGTTSKPLSSAFTAHAMSSAMPVCTQEPYRVAGQACARK